MYKINNILLILYILSKLFFISILVHHSIPTAEHCTGLRISNPTSINSGIRSRTAPQE